MFGYFCYLIVVKAPSDRNNEGSNEMITTSKPQFDSIDISSESERLTQSSMSGGLTQSPTVGGLAKPKSGGFTQSSMSGGFTQSLTVGGLAKPKSGGFTQSSTVGGLAKPKRSSSTSVASTEPYQTKRTKKIKHL